LAVSACGAKTKLQPALGETPVVGLPDGGFDSPRLHQIIYHLLIKRILSVGGFILPEKRVLKPFLRFSGVAFSISGGLFSFDKRKSFHLLSSRQEVIVEL
jgi:hypothetical protein